MFYALQHWPRADVLEEQETDTELSSMEMDEQLSARGLDHYLEQPNGAAITRHAAGHNRRIQPRGIAMRAVIELDHAQTWAAAEVLFQTTRCNLLFAGSAGLLLAERGCMLVFKMAENQANKYWHMLVQLEMSRDGTGRPWSSDMNWATSNNGRRSGSLSEAETSW